MDCLLLNFINSFDPLTHYTCTFSEIRESFHILDTDHDGLLTRYQVEQLVWRVDPDMTEEEMVDLLDTADLDGKRFADYNFVVIRRLTLYL